MTGDGREKVAALERIEARVRDRSNRGRSRNVSEQRDLPEVIAGERGDLRVPRQDLELAVLDDVEAIPRIVRADDDVTRGDGHRNERRCEVLFRREGKRREHRDVVDHRQLARGTGRRAVDRHEAAPRQEREHREDHADDDESRLRAHEADYGRSDDRPERDTSHRKAPDSTEGAGQHVVGNDPLKERERGDVLDAVGRAHDGQQEQRCREKGRGRH